jgi:hypothetical protein
LKNYYIIIKFLRIKNPLKPVIKILVKIEIFIEELRIV